MAATGEDFRARIDEINAIASGFVRAQVLFTANALEVFSLLERPATADAVAAARNLDPRAVRMLLDGLVALDLVVPENGKYRNTPTASMCLVPGGPAYQGNIVEHHRLGWDLWGKMPEAIRTGTSPKQAGTQRSSEDLRAFICGMNDIARFSAREMLSVIDLSGYRHLLDLGGGPATHAITALEAYPEMRATLFDHPDVVAIAKEQVAAAGLEARFSYRGEDFMTDDIGKGYDVILVSNIIHSYSEAANRGLVKKCFEALEPGGLLIIKDFLTEDDRSGPPFSLFFALRMLLATGEGDTYSRAQVAQWTTDAGFGTGRYIDLTPQTRLWLVNKP